MYPYTSILSYIHTLQLDLTLLKTITIPKSLLLPRFDRLEFLHLFSLFLLPSGVTSSCELGPSAGYSRLYGLCRVLKRGGGRVMWWWYVEGSALVPCKLKESTD